MPKPQITIIGHVGREPKRNTTQAGTPVATFPVAENHWRWDGLARQWIRTGTSWFHVTCRWGLSEHVAESVKTGDPVVVVGRLKIAEWADGNGVQQVTADVDATSVGHDLRRGTAKFSKVEPAKATTPPDEEAEIAKMREDPPEEPPDPFSNVSDAPPADPPSAAVDTSAGESPDDEPSDFESDEGDDEVATEHSGALQAV